MLFYDNQMNRIKYRSFKNSPNAIKVINSLGRKNDLDGELEVEDNFMIDNIVGFGATSVCYRTTMTTYNGTERILPIVKE